MPRIMFSSIGSNSGKTTVVCGILKALKNKNIPVRAFKCGPDYIDSMYHKSINVLSSNLDSFFCKRDEICQLLDCSEFSVIEGAMGFYDGISFTEKASAYEISQMTDTPVVIIMDCKGIANSVGALIKGFSEYRKNNIKGVIFNRISAMTYKKMAEIAENMDIIPLGYMPDDEKMAFKSRHLGLTEPKAIDTKINLIEKQVLESVDIDSIIKIAENTSDLEYNKTKITKKYNKKVAIAYDEAFSFIYDDNINMLKEYGCEIVFFSPLRARTLPDCDRLILSGGYPEIYAQRLSENKELLADIKSKIDGGLKTIAECGGFMYLHREIESVSGHIYNMANVINGIAYRTERLQNFGYFTMIAQKDNILCKKGESITCHEFHYWNSTFSGNSFRLIKPNSTREHKAVNTTANLYAGFPHIYFYGNRKALENFLED